MSTLDLPCLLSRSTPLQWSSRAGWRCEPWGAQRGSVQGWQPLCRHRDGLQGWPPVRSTLRFSSLTQLVRLLPMASTMLCVVVDVYLRAPVLSLTFLCMMKEEFLPDTVTTQNTISIALIIFLFLSKEATSALASANMQLFMALFPCNICPR